ncbi:putative phage tail protein [Paenibacillus sp. HB172176]|uniref:putative phage tail protein n=1 Tax=Paenibacillus sp. HB172176 TaxID=2493690 RepID=UPI001439F934|nr:putative phage tail protein [Paenibacillus sp. HB172176]
MAYGDGLYGALLFGDSADNGITPDATPPDLMGYLPSYWHSIRDMVELQTTLAEELGLTLSAAADLADQFYVSTATWGLTQWEREFGLTTDPSMSYEWRREIVLAKLRGHGTVTRQMLIGVAASFSGGEVDVLEYPGEYRFVIRFIGVLGVPANMAGFIAMLDQIKPAHLSYSFLFTYTTWDMVSELTWQEASAKTWSQLRIYEGG